MLPYPASFCNTGINYRITPVNNLALPCLGRISAGPPIFSPPDGEVIDFAQLFCAPDRFLLKVRGDDLYSAGIRDGDLLLIRHTARARDGELVLALIDGEDPRLGFYRQRAGRAELDSGCGRPLRCAAQRIRIQGRVIAQLRLWRH